MSKKQDNKIELETARFAVCGEERGFHDTDRRHVECGCEVKATHMLCRATILKEMSIRRPAVTSTTTATVNPETMASEEQAHIGGQGRI
jgi:hypothetical protein